VTHALSKVVSKAEVSNVIVRACIQCGTRRSLGEACEGCGLTDPPETHDLGVQAAYYRNPVRRLWWHLVTQPRASRRARAVNAQHRPS
jgi:hypothetical protein